MVVSSQGRAPSDASLWLCCSVDGLRQMSLSIVLAENLSFSLVFVQEKEVVRSDGEEGGEGPREYGK